MANSTKPGPGQPIEVISASAGTGKTAALLRVMSEALLGGQARPETLMAVTYTKKAASELTRRVRQKLLGEGKPELASAMGAARIGTVHSVCAELLTYFAYELGASPTLRALDEDETALTFQRALAEAVTDIELGSLSEIGARIDFSVHDLMVFAKRVGDLARQNGVDATALADCKEASLSQIDRVLPPAASTDPTPSLLAALSAYESANASPPDSTQATRGAHESVLTFCRKIRAGGALIWSDWVSLSKVTPGAKSRALFSPISDIAGRYPTHPRLRADLVEAIQAVYSMAGRALTIFAEKKEKLGVIDFNDMEQRTLALLDRPDVKARLAGEIELLLVDEFQDTNPIQLAIFLKLSKICPKSIWVGDAKQSIFGFQGADSALMGSVIEKVARGAPQILGDNYRSRAELTELTSNLFSKALAGDGIQPEQVKVQSHASVPTKFSLTALKFWGLDGRNQAQYFSSLASGVKSLLQQEPTVHDRLTGEVRVIEPGDIAILAFSNRFCTMIAGALKDQGIEATFPTGSLLSQPEVALTLAAYRLALYPKDRLSAAELTLLSGTNRDSFIRQAFSDASTEKWCEMATRLKELNGTFQETTPSELLDLVISTAGIEAFVESLEEGPRRLSHLAALRSVAYRYENQCAQTLAPCSAVGFLVHLGELADAEEDSLPGETRGSAVDVLTYHKAKGLEWPVVILAGTEGLGFPADLFSVRATGPEGKDFDLETPLRRRQILFLPWPFGTDNYGRKNQAQPISDRMTADPEWARLQAKALAEQRRVLYVGMTRPRESLIIASALKEKPFKVGSRMSALSDVDGNALLRFPEPSEKSVTIAGTAFSCEVEIFSPVEPETVKAKRQTILPAGISAAPITPLLHLVPSALQVVGLTDVDVQIGEKLDLGGKLTPIGQADAKRMGDAIHTFLAVDRPETLKEARLALATDVLCRWRVSQALAPGDLIKASDRYFAAMLKRFPGFRLQAELPLLLATSDGTELQGSIDALWLGEKEVVIVDHKSKHLAPTTALEVAKAFAAQLAVYASATMAAHPQLTARTWLHSPMGGLLVEVKISDPGRLVLRARELVEARLVDGGGR